MIERTWLAKHIMHEQTIGQTHGVMAGQLNSCQLEFCGLWQKTSLAPKFKFSVLRDSSFPRPQGGAPTAEGDRKSSSLRMGGGGGVVEPLWVGDPEKIKSKVGKRCFSKLT